MEARDFVRPGAPGFVYVLHCAAFPDLAKIGMTTRSPWERVAELSSATGLPEPFSLTKAFAVNDAAKAERVCHEQLSRYRYQPGREFFLDAWLESGGTRTSNRASMVEVVLSDNQLLAHNFAFWTPEVFEMSEELGRIRLAEAGVFVDEMDKLANRIKELEAEAAAHAAEHQRLMAEVSEGEARARRLEASVRQGEHMVQILRARLAQYGEQV